MLAQVMEKGPQANAHSPSVFLFCKYSHSVLRLRNQPTRPIPMLPNRIAPGAGMGATWLTSTIRSW